jgi:hypothetical protein
MARAPDLPMEILKQKAAGLQHPEMNRRDNMALKRRTRSNRSETGRTGRAAASASPRKSARGTGRINVYQCAIATNRGGKFEVRVRAEFGGGAWVLPAFYLASTLEGALKKLEGALRAMHRGEEHLRFWSVERSDDPKFTDELLGGLGLSLDRRKEFPGVSARLEASAEKRISAASLRKLRSELAAPAASGRQPATRS